MSELKHTPGKWVSRAGTTTGSEVVGKKPRGGDYVIARCGGKDREANARLIAAAPELLEFAEEWLCMQGSDENYMTAKARAAIAKATGESK